MSASQKLRWRRLVNEMRFVHEEIDIVTTVISQGEKEFYEYYRRYAERNGHDVEALNRQNQEKVSAAYAPPPAVESKAYEVTGSITLYDGAPTPSNQAPTRYEMTKDETEMHECFSKLFKSIALKIHPDKIPAHISGEQREEYISMFKDATVALERQKYFVLLDMAETLKIPQPKNYKQQTRWMKKEVGILREALATQKGVYTYLFFECETDEERDNLIRRFMTQLFGPLPTNNT